MGFSRFTFGLKILAALSLVALADILFFFKTPGSTIGLFALAWTGAALVATPAIRKRREALIALCCAAVLALVLADDPSLLGWGLFWGALSAAVLLRRCQFRNAWQFAQRLAIQAMTSLFLPLLDLSRLVHLPRPNLRRSVLSLMGVLALPVAGTLVFIALFATANPLIARSLPDLQFPSLDGMSLLRFLFWMAAFALVWPSLRPSRWATRVWRESESRAVNLPGVTVLSVMLSLALFNVIFAVENLLDIIFLWSGAPLPQGVTLADYAHRGAYPLIVTALLAGVFVLVTANPQSELGQRAGIRRLVVFWIFQNIILVASSIIRTVDYIDAYMLTRLRIAALIWMALVATGLGLICWRIIARLSLRWLINSTALAAFVVLSAVCVIDLGSIAAEWNVRHAREAGGSGQPLDLGYLRDLGPSAMVALASLEARPIDPAFRAQVAGVRREIVQATQARQAEQFGWTWRNARRLAQVNAILGTAPSVTASLTPAPGK